MINHFKFQYTTCFNSVHPINQVIAALLDYWLTTTTVLKQNNFAYVGKKVHVPPRKHPGSFGYVLVVDCWIMSARSAQYIYSRYSSIIRIIKHKVGALRPSPITLFGSIMFFSVNFNTGKGHVVMHQLTLCLCKQLHYSFVSLMRVYYWRLKHTE